MVSRRSLVPLLCVLLSASGALASYDSCTKCEPHRKCWPSAKDWQQLSKTVSGRLSALVPAAKPCHDPHYNNGTCSAFWEGATSQDWRVSTPETTLWPQFETSPLDKESCFSGTSREDQCKQGSVPIYSIKALETSDIVAGVKFASKHNIRISIRNTGHDFLGRSAGRNSLQIWTGNMKGIDFSDNWKGKGCRPSKADKGEHAVTINAGVQLHELYSALAQRGRSAVIGFSKTVGAAGGYIHGGGHGPLGPLYGQASDNALEYEVVTANGKIVAANACQNTDLFWALRGGGGGTFGITTRVTLRTFPDPDVVFWRSNFSMPTEGGIWPIVDLYHSLAPKMSDLATYSLYFALPTLPGTNTSALSIISFTPKQESTAKMDAFHQPLVDYARSNGGYAEFASIHAPSMMALFYSLVEDDSVSDPTVAGSLPSRLVSAAYLSNPATRPNLVKALSKIKIRPGEAYLGHVVSGGAVAKNVNLDTALNPAWRKAAIHVIAPLTWTDDDEMTWEKREAILREMREQHKELKALEPDMGAYGNEADFGETDWQKSFWGTNYERLLKVKKKWDPKRLFICNRCVGSEGCRFY
ncbi:FAD binding domain-containing protein [Ascobolus immersus RN42]|uniref:FAD binding domain-containing protein n=1 Tax=Ascobolus immersus RN42 TaxID=1160509 RepID=A0A3N4HHN8_ASCIM|nr:FAD binding domain-containing protein [Ascobolus immersus RN42]